MGRPADTLSAARLRDLAAPGWLVPAATPARLRAADDALAGRICLIGETHPLPARPRWRESPSRDKEWLIALHKHPFAVDLAAAYRASGRPAYLLRWAELTESWLAEMGSGFISASDAQVEAKRVEHWCLALAALAGTDADDLLPPDLLPALLARIADEAAYILANLRPSRNHRTFQLASVCLAGALLPELPGAAALLDLGAQLLAENLLADLLPDGVQVELSTHYHQLVLESAVLLLGLARWRGLALPPELGPRILAGLEFALWAQWPDGSLPLLGDSDDGDQRPLLARGADLLGSAELRWGATLGRAGAPPPQPARHFADAGYFVLSDGWGAGPEGYRARQHVIFDCGPLGEGSHAHYDLLSLTYFAGGQPLLIDPGRYTYDAAPDADGVDWRHAFKATAAHNTVTIDGLDQTRYLSKWRRDREGWARGGPKHGPAPTILDRRWRLGAQSDWVDATIASAEYTPRHRRLLLYMRRQYLLLIDLIAIEDGAEHRCDLRLHLAPAALGRVELGGGQGAWSASAPGVQIVVAGPPELAARVEQGWASRDYGLREPAPALSFALRSSRSVAIATAIAPAGAAHIERLTLRGDPGTGWLRCAASCSAGGASWTDELLVEAAGPRSGGRHLALRRDARGRLEYLCAHGIGRPASKGGAGAPQEDVEWSR